MVPAYQARPFDMDGLAGTFPPRNDAHVRDYVGQETTYSLYGKRFSKRSHLFKDLDSGENGLVAYSIFKGNASLFSVNSATGKLYGIVSRLVRNIFHIKFEIFLPK